MSVPLPLIHSPLKPGQQQIHLDPRAYDRGLVCVHCGLCLPACPTYTETLQESDSPRGRIQIMLGLTDGAIDMTPGIQNHLDLCLDCRACETACPSGVIYHELIEDFRHHNPSPNEITLQGRLMRWIFFNIFTHRSRLKWAVLPARLMQKTGIYALLRKTGLFKLLPQRLAKMEQMLPAHGRLWPRELPEFLHARRLDDSADQSNASTSPQPNSRPIKRVGFFVGCVGSVMYDEVNRKAVELLAAAGCDVVTDARQVCCGAIHNHNGATPTAHQLARHNIDTFLPLSGPQVDLIATNIAGCGAMLREYDFLFRDDPAYAQRAKDFASRVRDISEVLLEVGLPPMNHPIEQTVTYHDACHLAHAQKVTNAPRQLLAMIPGIKIKPLYECDMCCGAAGTYNLTQPEMATELAERKLKYIGQTKAGICAAGNVGCAMHIQSEADRRGQPIDVVHPVDLLHQAVFGPGK
ncbi:MAG: 4Fe-4S dicluster domain-containing protein [Phycisphaerales bacterium]|nr:4Fe-4S dicluster domain-containing protein [Phycisphaerales bacterium]